MAIEYGQVSTDRLDSGRREPVAVATKTG